jgi:hypothetical protein
MCVQWEHAKRCHYSPAEAAGTGAPQKQKPHAGEQSRIIKNPPSVNAFICSLICVPVEKMHITVIRVPDP